MLSDRVSLEDVRAAADLLAGRVERTPLLRVDSSHHRRDDVDFFLKLECHQRAGSFKARGAGHFLARLTASQEVVGVVTYSSGNHGRAVAEAAAAFGVRAVVTVPDHVDASKAAAIEAAGAELLRAGPTSESRKSCALAIAAERGYAVIPPFDHPWIIAGQGTALLEALEDLPSPPVAVWAPVGGGGLAAGSSVVVEALLPDAGLHTVEPEGAAAWAESEAAGRVVRLDETKSIADGLLPLAVGERNFAQLASARVVSHRVTDEEIASTFRRLRRDLEVPCEPSGAVSSTPIFTPNGRAIEPGVHLAIVSGGNISAERLAALLG